MFSNSNYKGETLYNVLERDPDLCYVHDDIEYCCPERRLDHPQYDDSQSSISFDWCEDRDASTDEGCDFKLSQNSFVLPDEIF